MNKKEKGITQDEKFSEKEMTNTEALKITQELVKEFIDTKQRMLTDDRKLNAIGKALIDQKRALSDINNVQSSHGKELSESLGNVVEKQKGISLKVDTITQSMEELQEAKAEQEKFLEELGHFQKRHGQLVEISKKQSQQSIERLQVIAKNVTKLFEHINQVDIEEQVLDISNRTAEINELLKVHAGEQERSREEASRTMLDLLSEVTSFKRQLSNEGLVGRLADIQKTSVESKKEIDNLNKKFDTFIEVYELSKIETKKSLEDIFPEEEIIDDEDINEIDYELNETVDGVENIDELEIEQPEEDNQLTNDKLPDDLEDSKEESMDVQVGNLDKSEESEDLPHLSIEGKDVEDSFLDEIKEIPEYGKIEPEKSTIGPRKERKKQGFFSKLFGGR